MRLRRVPWHLLLLLLLLWYEGRRLLHRRHARPHRLLLLLRLPWRRIRGLLCRRLWHLLLRRIRGHGALWRRSCLRLTRQGCLARRRVAGRGRSGRRRLRVLRRGLGVRSAVRQLVLLRRRQLLSGRRQLLLRRIAARRRRVSRRLVLAGVGHGRLLRLLRLRACRWKARPLCIELRRLRLRCEVRGGSRASLVRVVVGSGEGSRRMDL